MNPNHILSALFFIGTALLLWVAIRSAMERARKRIEDVLWLENYFEQVERNRAMRDRLGRFVAKPKVDFISVKEPETYDLTRCDTGHEVIVFRYSGEASDPHAN